MTAGATTTPEVIFPEQHNNPDFRGKKGRFHVTVKEVRERVFPEVDDEFAKDCGEDTLDVLRTSVRAKLQKELEERASQSIAEHLVVELSRRNPLPGRRHSSNNKLR